MNDMNDSLQRIREEIDSIDNAIHDLLMRRTKVVEQVTELKKNQAIKIRPAREAKIIYRLVSRHHGGFPKRELVRIWRELIVATLAFEGPFSVAVCAPRSNPGYWQLARNHFGAHTKMVGYPSQRRALEAVQSGQATVGILPRPYLGEADPWWRHLVRNGENVPRIVARLPFVAPVAPGSDDAEAMVICPISMEPSGRDVTVFGMFGGGGLSSGRLSSIFSDAELETENFHQWVDPNGDSGWFAMTEVKGFIGTDDPRYVKVFHGLQQSDIHLVPIGGYAEPLTTEELDN